MAKKRDWIRRRLKKIALGVKWPSRKRKQEVIVPSSAPLQPAIDTSGASQPMSTVARRERKQDVIVPSSAPLQPAIDTSGASQPISTVARIKRDVERYDRIVQRTVSTPPVLQSTDGPSALYSPFRPMVVSEERRKSRRIFQSAFEPNEELRVLPINVSHPADSYSRNHSYPPRTFSEED
jgi:hypothetical protein